MYCIDLKAVLHRRASCLLLDSTSTEVSHRTMAQMVSCFHEFNLPWSINLLCLVLSFRCTFLGLYIRIAPKTRSWSWTHVIWGNSTSSEDTQIDLEANELMLPRCSLYSHEPPSPMNIWNLAAQFCFACYWEWLPWQGSWTSTPHAVGHSLHLVQSLREPGFHKRNWVWKFFTLQ